MTKTLPILDAEDFASAPTSVAHGTAGDDAPEVPLSALDQLWFQVAGTVCNLRCNHCFISCSPDNHSFWFMSREEVRAALDESVRLGVKEYYFTGGEPFMNVEMLGILEDTLALGPATVLTNATLLPQRTVDGLARLSAATLYSLELRVSIDGVTAEMNDAIRGEGTFDRALDAVARLTAADFLPIITTMQTWEDQATERMLSGFRELLAGVGCDRPRIKILPPLRIGAEARRAGGYRDSERVTREMMRDYPADMLLCSRARLVTHRGVWVCPILLDHPGSRLADSLRSTDAVKPARLSEQACYTCWLHGAICSNLPGYAQDFS
jgi:uncharacterized Fe-S cluster-containing radical SAM superfamily protein